METNINPSIFLQFNSLTEPETFPSWEIALKVTFYVFAFLLDVIGNTLVLLIIGLNKRMRSTTNILLLNQAVSDLMVAAFCMWVHLGNQITPEWPFGPFVCKVNTFIQVMAVTSSVLSMTAISVERFTAIVFPLKAHWTARTNCVIIALLWLTSAAVAFPHLIVRHQFEQTWKNRHEIWCDEQWTKVYKDEECNTWEPGKVIYYSLEGIVMYFLPVIIMIVAYTIITIQLLTHKSPGILVSSAVSAQEKAKRKVIRMLVAVLVCFVICWTPQQVMLLWDIFRPRGKTPKYTKTVKFIALYIAYFNSALNPVLYGGFNDNFRRGFQDIFRRVFTKRNKVHPGMQDVQEQGKPKLNSGQQNNPNNTAAILTDKLEKPVSGQHHQTNMPDVSPKPVTSGETRRRFSLTTACRKDSLSCAKVKRSSFSSDDTTDVPWQSLR